MPMASASRTRLSASSTNSRLRPGSAGISVKWASSVYAYVRLACEGNCLEGPRRMKGQDSIFGLTPPSGIRTQHSFDGDFLERQRHVNSLRPLDELHDVVERQSEHEYAGDDHHLRRI